MTKSITENTKENQVFGSGNGKKASLFGPKKRRTGQILCLEERTHEHDPFTKTSKTSCCGAIKTYGQGKPTLLMGFAFHMNIHELTMNYSKYNN